MGLDKNGTRFLLYSRICGIDFTESAIIGRQALHLSKQQLVENLSELDFSYSNEAVESIFAKEDGYAEEFLRCLGAKVVHSFDNSNYENATHIHDMNQELAEAHKNQYSMVLDGGSLEHVFNFPVAIRNCMQMVKPGGHFLAITPTNNFLGHGFYQFSPELFFRIFTSDNGFELEDIIIFENTPKSKWYKVKSPNEARSRVTLVNSQSSFLLIIAKKVKETQIFRENPQQSDYVSAWNEQDESEAVAIEQKKNKIDSIIKKRVPDLFKPVVRRMLKREFPNNFYQELVIPKHKANRVLGDSSVS